jgi:hypothetical protein
MVDAATATAAAREELLARLLVERFGTQPRRPADRRRPTTSAAGGTTPNAAARKGDR